MTSDSSICEMAAFEIQTRDMHTSDPITGLSLRGGSQPLSKESRRKIETKETPSCLISHLLVVFTATWNLGIINPA